MNDNLWLIIYFSLTIKMTYLEPTFLYAEEEASVCATKIFILEKSDFFLTLAINYSKSHEFLKLSLIFVRLNDHKQVKESKKT